jgi:hypothetical protein
MYYALSAHSDSQLSSEKLNFFRHLVGLVGRRIGTSQDSVYTGEKKYNVEKYIHKSVP